MVTSDHKAYLGLSREKAQSSVLPDISMSISTRKQNHTLGLTPPNVESHAQQARRCLHQLASKQTPIEKYMYLSSLRKTNVHLFYRLVMGNLTDLTPLIYTPVVGEACLRWSEIYQYPEGLYLSYNDRGSIARVLQNWPEPKVEITVITDGSRILGLGDLGINGMGIPVGKLSLYIACAGIKPEVTLPLTIDFGTDSEKLLKDPFYLGSKSKRVSDREQAEFIDEMMLALNKTWPGLVVQFEDFKNPWPPLEKYQNVYPCFNDDIQGTGAVILAGIINALKITGGQVKDQRAVFFGAGSAGTGVAQQIVEYFITEGLSEDEARQCFWFVDTKGLITSDRGDKLATHKLYFARNDNNGMQHITLAEVVEYVKPTILMGLSTIRGAFNRPIVERMAKINNQPIIFPLSNPFTQAECTFKEAIDWTEGRAVFASGSPFTPYVSNGITYSPSQGNNMFVFPGIGLAAILSKATKLSNEMVYASAVALSKAINQTELEKGLLYPEIDRIREVSVVVAREVIKQAQKQGLDQELSIRNFDDAKLDAWIQTKMYDPAAVFGMEQQSSLILGGKSLL